MNKAPTYKQAGVDISKGDALVDWLISSSTETQSESPHKNRIVSGIGGFSALFRGDFPQMKAPLLVSSTDGVGTKVKLAAQFGRFESVGQDLVAMCVNDLICTGGQPLFFLDYYACAKLNLQQAQEFLKGVRKACTESGCALIGGETAEMPGVYHDGDFDCAGFVVGVVDEPKVLGAARVKAGDTLLAISSSGFHSNGYSLLRKVFEADMDKWADILMRPTHLYPKLVEKLKSLENNLHAVAHVTGGGMDNLERVIPDGTAIKLNPWKVPDEFREVRKRANMQWADMLITLNCGVGLVIYVAPSAAAEVIKIAKSLNFNAWEMGQVIQSEEKSWSMDWDKFSHLNGDK